MPRDPRELALNDITRAILTRDNYDAHFSTFEQRVIVEDRLFLARYDAVTRMHRDRTLKRGDINYFVLGRAELAGAAYVVLQDVKTGRIAIVSETEVDGGAYREAG